MAMLLYNIIMRPARLNDDTHQRRLLRADDDERSQGTARLKQDPADP
jgi:hypothetical protein